MEGENTLAGDDRFMEFLKPRKIKESLDWRTSTGNRINFYQPFGKLSMNFHDYITGTSRDIVRQM